jgi:hypothetical protein
MIEIGIGEGENAVHVLNNVGPDFTYFGIDPFVTYSSYKGDVNSEPRMVAYNLKRATQRFKYWEDRSQTIKFIKTWSHLATHHFRKGEMDLIFVDGNHSKKSVEDDIELYWEKLRAGGVMVVRDYGVAYPDIKGVVESFITDADILDVARANGLFIFSRDDYYLRGDVS